MKNKTLLVFIILCLSLQAIAQLQSKTTLTAKLSLIQSKSDLKGGKQSVFAVSFTNNSDFDIYVPEILTISTEPNGGLIKIYKKSDNVYQALPMFGGKISNPDISQISGNVVSGYSNEIEQHYNLLNKRRAETYNQAIRDNLKEKDLRLDTLNLFDYQNRPLFLKAHEEITGFYVVSVDELLFSKKSAQSSEVSHKSEDYKITYEPTLKFSNIDKLPQSLLGFRKFIPSEISCNTIYLSIEE